MRVAYLLFDPGIPVGGTKGASVHVAEFLAAVVALGHEVHLVATNVVGEVPAGAVLHHIALKGLSKSEASKLAAAREFAGAALEVLAAIRPDLICERLSLFFDSGGALAKAVGARRVLEINAPIVRERLDNFGLEMKDEAIAAERGAIADSDAVVVSQVLASYARENGARSVRVVANGVDPSRFDCAKRAPMASVSSNVPVVGFVGSLKPWHGVENLVLASALLVSWGMTHRLLIIGDGPQSSRIAEVVSQLGAPEHIELVGAVPMAQIPEHLASMDIGVAPYRPSSDFYFSPLKVLEYMAAGLAVVATDAPSIRSLVADTGVLVKDPTPTSLAAAIGELLVQSDLRTRMGVAARDRIERRFAWITVAKSILRAP